MIAAVIFFAGSAGVSQAVRDLLYFQMDVTLGRMLPPPDFADKMLMYTKLNAAEGVLQWSTIFAVKFSYMIFFRPLISRVRVLEIWWWVVLVILVPCAGIAMFMGIYVCAVFNSGVFSMHFLFI